MAVSSTHAAPPAASQGGALNPDGINPGQCADRSNPPASEMPNGGLNCVESNGDAASLSGVHADGAISGGLRKFQSTRSASAADRDLTVIEAALRVAYGGRSYVADRLDREAVSRRCASDGARCEREYARGFVRLRRFAVAQHDVPATPPAASPTDP